jgi:hypothetical protein
MWSPGFVLIADFAAKIQMICLFNACGKIFSLLQMGEFAADVAKIICMIQALPTLRHRALVSE